MYICLCNALTDRDLHRVAAAGARRPREVYESCGARAKCGSCTEMILCVLRTLTAERGEADAAAAPAAAT